MYKVRLRGALAGGICTRSSMRFYEDSAGVQNRTGTTYAANVYTQQYFVLSRDALGGYVLEALEEAPEESETPEA